MLRHTLIATAMAAGVLLGVPGASANTFKWANDGDTNSMDPYTRNETFLLSFAQNIYDPLVRRNRELKIEPALAHSTQQIFGGTYTPSDESGDAKVFTQQLAQRCAERGVKFLWQHEVQGFDLRGREVSFPTYVEPLHPMLIQLDANLHRTSVTPVAAEKKRHR